MNTFLLKRHKKNVTTFCSRVFNNRSVTLSCDIEQKLYSQAIRWYGNANKLNLFSARRVCWWMARERSWPGIDPRNSACCLLIIVMQAICWPQQLKGICSLFCWLLEFPKLKLKNCSETESQYQWPKVSIISYSPEVLIKQRKCSNGGNDALHKWNWTPLNFGNVSDTGNVRDKGSVEDSGGPMKTFREKVMARGSTQRYSISLSTLPPRPSVESMKTTRLWFVRQDLIKFIKLLSWVTFVKTFRKMYNFSDFEGTDSSIYGNDAIMTSYTN